MLLRTLLPYDSLAYSVNLTLLHAGPAYRLLSSLALMALSVLITLSRALAMAEVRCLSSR